MAGFVLKKKKIHQFFGKLIPIFFSPTSFLARIFYSIISTFVAALYAIDFREIIIDDRYHFDYFRIKILDRFCSHLCKFNYDPTSSEGPLLSRFWEFFFKNAHSFSFVIVIANLKYSIKLYLLPKCYFRLQTSSYSARILS